MEGQDPKIEDLGALWDLDFFLFLADTRAILFENIVLTCEII